MLRLFVVGLLFAFGMVLLTSLGLYVNLMTRPAPSALCCSTPADMGFDYADVSFVSEDDVTLSGWYIPTQNGAAVIVLHGYFGNRGGMLAHMQMLAQNGYGVLLYDLRGHGQSSAQLRSYGWRDINDVAAALAFIEQQANIDPERIGILGFSMGGQIALRAAAQIEQLKAVVADGASPAQIRDINPPESLNNYARTISSWVAFQAIALRVGKKMPAGIVESIETIAPRPLLLIASGEGDEQLRMQRYYDQAQEPKTLWEIPHTTHGQGVFVEPSAYEEHIIALFDQGLLAQP